MADKKISALASATTPLAGTEILPVVQSGATVNVSVANLTAGRAVSVSTLATTGNLALGGASFSAWTVYDAGTVEKTNGAFWASFTDQSRFGLNAYYAFQWVYKQNGFSSQYEQTSGSHKFYTAPSGTAGNAITYTQALTVDQATNNVTANVGNFVVGTAGKGIDFSAATHAAGMTSELLNDYEEGTWTPSVGGLATYFAQNGTYTKVGRLVFVQGLVYINAILTGSTTTISGLPFTPGNDSTATLTYFSGLATNVVSINGRIAAGASNIILYGLTAAGSASQTAITTFQNQTYVQFSAVYSI